MPNGMATIQRHPTIPLSKRDSVLSNGTRMSLLNSSGNGSASRQFEAGNGSASRQFEDTDFVNTNPEMVSGKKRTPKSPKKVKRTDSYKKATNRQSAFDELDGLSGEQRDSYRGGEVRASGHEDRTKYNTLPLNTRHNVTCASPPLASETRRRKNNSGGGNASSDLARGDSRKSATYYPSPDTDDDQRSTQPDRKKKSAFKKMKERLISTFQKDRDHRSDKYKHAKAKSPGKFHKGRVYSNNDKTSKGFRTPGCEIEERPEPHRYIGTSSHGTSQGHNGTNGKSPGLLQSLRNSFRKKQAPEKYRSKAATGGKASSSESPVTPVQATQGNANPAGGSRPYKPPTGTREAISHHKPGRQSATQVHVQDDTPLDPITELFDSLIDPCTTRAPDRTKLRLEGLRKCRPSTYSGGDQADGPTHSFPSTYNGDLSPTVEIDGLDYPDGPDSRENDLSFAVASEEEQQRRIDAVSSRLAAIGDRIASERRESGSSSEVDGHRVGGHSAEFDDRQLLRDLQQFGDEFDKTLFKKCGEGMSVSIVPIIKNILLAQDYSGFKTTMQRELSRAIGWEEVAWYTYLIKTAVLVAGTGSTVKSYATRYFTSTLRPWIEARPNGWESITEETDVDSELD